MDLLRVEHICKTYGSGETAVHALKDVSFSVPKGEFVAIVGESGSGKSTLLNMIGALDTPTSGRVYINEKDTFAMKEKALTIFRRRNIGFIFQAFNLIPELSVEQNMIFPLLLDRQRPNGRYLDELLSVLGLEQRRGHLPSQLSGGQQQRVAIGRALMTRPSLVLADEPTGNLDSQNSSEVLALLKETARKYEQTVIMITHNRMTRLCIIFAVFLVTGIFSMADIFIQSETANVKEAGGNWHINLENISEEDAASIARRPDVSASSWFDMVNFDQDRSYTIGGIQTALGGVEDPFRTEIMTYFPEGASLDEGEVILTPNAKTMLGVDVGDRVSLDTPAGSYDLLITGFRSGNSRYATDSGVGESTALPVKGEQVGAFLQIETFREILAANEDAGNPAYYIQFSERANARRTLSEIKEQFPEAKVNEHMILLAAVGASENRMAKNVYPLVIVFCLLVLLAGVLMISGSLNSAIAQRTQFFGMMRCIGMSKKQVIHFVELEALNWCKTAIPSGIILGTAATWLVLAFMHRFVGGEFARMAVFGISPIGMVSGAVVGILTVLLAARAPAKKAAKVSPVVRQCRCRNAETAAGQHQFAED